MRIPIGLLYSAARRVMQLKSRGSAYLIVCAALVLFVGVAIPARAHPVPFSYLDVSIESGEIHLTLVVHVYDAAQELGVNPLSFCSIHRRSVR